MIKAVDCNGVFVSIDDADMGTQYYCPICGQPLIQKRGMVREHHFSHVGQKNGSSSPINCSDLWKYDKSDWHIAWQKRFPVECYEKVLIRGKQKHIADIVINNLVIEFQHSSISLEEFRERNTFYSSCGYSVIWVFDLIDEFNNGHITDQDDGKYYWSYAKKLFREMDLKNELASIYFQLGYDDELGDDELFVEKVTNAYRNFSVFYTDLTNALSIEEFLRYAKEDTGKLLTKNVQSAGYGNPIVGGFTVFELWDPKYSGMIVRKITDGQEMLINGDEHGIFRQDHDPHGRIVGKYTRRGYDGRYHYSSYYVVWDAEKPVWTLKRPFFKDKKDI